MARIRYACISRSQKNLLLISIRLSFTIRYKKSFISAPLKINIHYESSVQPVNKYISKTKSKTFDELRTGNWTKKSVLNFDLKIGRDRSLFFKYVESEFHAVSPETGNPRESKVLLLIIRVQNSHFETWPVFIRKNGTHKQISLA